MHMKDEPEKVQGDSMHMTDEPEKVQGDSMKDEPEKVHIDSMHIKDEPEKVQPEAFPDKIEQYATQCITNHMYYAFVHSRFGSRPFSQHCLQPSH